MTMISFLPIRRLRDHLARLGLPIRANRSNTRHRIRRYLQAIAVVPNLVERASLRQFGCWNGLLCVSANHFYLSIGAGKQSGRKSLRTFKVPLPRVLIRHGIHE